jgi:hypothetical protein
MPTFFFSLCDHCKHRREGDTCAAFPNGIPSLGFHFNTDHRRPFEGDNGIQFEPKDEAARQRVAKLPHPVDPEKVYALARRVFKVRHEINAILEETGRKLPSRFTYRLEWSEKFEDLPEDIQKLVLDAEKRAGQTSTAL